MSQLNLDWLLSEEQDINNDLGNLEDIDEDYRFSDLILLDLNREKIKN